MRGGRGSRGGRSRSSRSSSRRHYRSRRMHGRSFYYGGYYGSRGGVTEVGRLGSLIFLFFFLGILYLIFSLAAYGIISAPTTNQIYLEPGRQVLVEIPSNIESVDIVFPGEIYVMDTAPPVTGISTVPNTASDTIPADSYSYWQVSVFSGTVVSVSWTASSPVSVYLLKGLSEFNSWIDGSTPSGSFMSSDSSGSFEYTASKSMDIYVAFENPGYGGPSIDLTRTITLKEPLYDTSQGTKFVGEANIKVESTKYIVLKNNQNVDIQATVTEHKKFGPDQFKTVWSVISLVLILLSVFVIGRFGKEKKNVASTPQYQTTQPFPTVQVHQPSWVASPPQQSNLTPMTRPPPIYCPSCSTPVLASDRFCASCGVNLSKS